MKKAYETNKESKEVKDDKALAKEKEDDKYVQNLEKVLEGLKSAGEELKKKHNFVKGKEGHKKMFDELIHKFVSKIGLDQTKSINNKQFDQNDLLLLDFMMKNGLIKSPEGLNPNLIANKEEIEAKTNTVNGTANKKNK